MAEADFDPERLLRALSDAEVRYVLIGGMAAILHGDAGVTIDLDIAPAFDPDNHPCAWLPRCDLWVRASAPRAARKVSRSTVRARSCATSDGTRC